MLLFFRIKRQHSHVTAESLFLVKYLAFLLGLCSIFKLIIKIGSYILVFQSKSITYLFICSSWFFKCMLYQFLVNFILVLNSSLLFKWHKCFHYFIYLFLYINTHICNVWNLLLFCSFIFIHYLTILWLW